MRIIMMRSWTAGVGIRVGMFILRPFFFFARAHIGLLIEPGRETEKLIIVPLGWSKTPDDHPEVYRGPDPREQS